MRKYAYLKEPFHLDDGGIVYKIMYYDTPSCNNKSVPKFIN